MIQHNPDADRDRNEPDLSPERVAEYLNREIEAAVRGDNDACHRAIRTLWMLPILLPDRYPMPGYGDGTGSTENGP